MQNTIDQNTSLSPQLGTNSEDEVSRTSMPAVDASVTPPLPGKAPDQQFETGELWMQDPPPPMPERARAHANPVKQRVTSGARAVHGAAVAVARPATERGIRKSKGVAVPPGHTVEVLHPLPQRGAPPRRPPRRLAAGGLVLAELGTANPASSAKWLERPVNRITPSSEPCLEDPDLACYIWNRSLNKPMNKSRLECVEVSRRRCWGPAP